MLRTLERLGRYHNHYWIQGGQNVEDISRLYDQSVIKYRGTKYQCKRGNCALYSEHFEGVFIGVYTSGRDEVRWIPFADIDSSFPELGYYNLKGNAIMISRNVASRNWRYAFHKVNNIITAPYVNMGTDLCDAVINVSRSGGGDKSINAYLECTDGFSTFQKALADVAGGVRPSVPLSRRVAIASSPFKNEIGIFLLGNKVGTYINDEVVIDNEWARESIEEVM